MSMWNCISKFCYDTYLKSYTGFKKNNSVFEHTKTSEKRGGGGGGGRGGRGGVFHTRTKIFESCKKKISSFFNSIVSQRDFS